MYVVCCSFFASQIWEAIQYSCSFFPSSFLFQQISFIPIAFSHPYWGISWCVITECLALLAKEETVLQDINDRLIKAGKFHGMEMNVENPNVIRISRQSSPAQITIEQKQPENLNYLSSVITNDARWTGGINSRTAMTGAGFNLFQEQILTWN